MAMKVIYLRVEDELADQLKAEADADGRSLNSHIVARLSNKLKVRTDPDSMYGGGMEIAPKIGPISMETITVDDEDGIIEQSTEGEKTCCDKTKPCAHWAWDEGSEVWQNTLSGRVWES